MSEELVREKIAGFGAILSEAQSASIAFSFTRTVRQKPSETGGTSAREKEGMLTRRMFHLFDLRISSEIFEEMKRHGSIRVLSPEEVASTNGGANKGKTHDGAAIADNIGLL